MNKFNQFESKYYDFYKFTRLVVDLLIIPNNFSIPYDIEMELIYKAYVKHEFLDNGNNNPYDEMVAYIDSSKELLLDLQASNEGY